VRVQGTYLEAVGSEGAGNLPRRLGFLRAKFSFSVDVLVLGSFTG